MIQESWGRSITTKGWLIMASVVLIALFSATLATSSSQPYITDHQINFGTGNKYVSATDIRIDGPGIALSFKRTYNSQDESTGLMGYGWTTKLTEKLEINADYIHLVREDGRVVYFSDDGSGTFINDNGRRQTIVSGANDYLLTLHNGTTKQFDSAGKLLKITDLNQNTLSYSYSDDLVDTITTNFGRSLAFSYQDGKLSQMATPAGVFTYGYDSNGNLVFVSKPDTTTVRYIYDDPSDSHNLTGIINENNTRVLTVAYDTEDRATSSSLAEGQNTVTIAYPSPWERLVTDASDSTTTYTLDAKNGVVVVDSFSGPGCSSCGSTSDSSYLYNDRGQVLSSTDGNGVVTAYEFDDRGNRITTTRAAGTADETIIRTTYTADNKVKTRSRVSALNPEESQITSYSYDGAGNLLGQTEVGFTIGGQTAKTTSYSYDAAGRLIAVDGPRNDVADTTLFTYYDNTQEAGNNRGNLHTVTNGLGHTTTYADYTAFGQAKTITSPNTVITAVYDTMGRLLSRTQQERSTSYSYDAAGRLMAVSMPEGRTLTYSYTTNDLVSGISDSLGNSINYFYDERGKVIKEELHDPERALTRFLEYSYHESGHLETTVYADTVTTRLSYDNVGNITAVKAGNNAATVYNYDNLNRLVSIAEPGDVVTSIGYDSHNNQVQITDANNNATVSLYDDFGNVVSRISPDSGTTQYEYDLAGNLRLKIDGNGAATAYSYDALNRLTSVSYPDSALNVAYLYDQGDNGVGRLFSMIDQTGSSSYSYDQFGNLVNETREINGHSFSVSYGYNANNELISVTYPSGRVIDYLRDSAGRVTAILSTHRGITENLMENVGYLPFGPMTTADLANGLTLANTYDALYRLTGTSVGTIFDRSFSYDDAGRVQLIADNIVAEKSQSFTYDALGRLTTATGIYGLIAFSYDSTGNRLSQTVDGVSSGYSYLPGTNKLDQITGSYFASYSYDDAGNILANDEQQFDWNSDGRLNSVTVDANTVAEYGYDGKGLRTSKTTGEGTQLAIYDASGNLIAETDDSGQIIREFAYLNGQRIALFDYAVLPADFAVTVSSTVGTYLERVSVYAFDENNRYTGVYGVTDAEGKAVFQREAFGEGSYSFRVDYLGGQFWTEAVVVQSEEGLDLIIAEDSVEITLIAAKESIAGAKIYVFTESGAYLGVSTTTDADGKASLLLPEGQNYTFRADLNGSKYWSETVTITGGGLGIVIDTEGGIINLVVQESTDTPITGIKTYLFTDGGAYLARNATTDEAGSVLYRVSAGSYKIRVDYLGYQFWSDVITLGAADHEAFFEIAHTDVRVSVEAAEAGISTPLEDINTYLFSPAGSYLNVSGRTNSQGQIIYRLPDRAYTVRADVLGQQFWSEEFTAEDPTISIDYGTAELKVINLNEPIGGVKVFVFDEAGSYLNLNKVTDSAGEVRFSLPQGTYRFRADYQGSQFWGEGLNLIAHQTTSQTLSTGGDFFVVTLIDQDSNPLAGVRCNVFSDTGIYLNEYGNSDGQGKVGFNLADGSYSIRIDYLGHHYWLDELLVPSTEEITYTIEHQPVTITGILQYGASQKALGGVRAYLFNADGNYLNLNTDTDALGRAVFNLPAQNYKVRLDYLGQKYWTDVDGKPKVYQKWQ